jgi:cytochrome c biogenesis protein ResB
MALAGTVPAGVFLTHIDDNQYLQFAANYYNAEQDSDYASDTSVKNTPAGTVQVYHLRCKHRHHINRPD